MLLHQIKKYFIFYMLYELYMNTFIIAKKSFTDKNVQYVILHCDVTYD